MLKVIHLTATERHLPYEITCHPTQVNTHRLNLAAKPACTLFTYPGGMEVGVDLGGWLYRPTEIVYLSADNHPSK